jgi:hypothetical protein
VSAVKDVLLSIFLLYFTSVALAVPHPFPSGTL